MASKNILGCCLILACFVSMATAKEPRSEDVSYRGKRQYKSFSSAYARGCRPSPQEYHYYRKLSTFIDCFSFGGHTYYLSQEFYRDVSGAQFVCNLFGASIVQINTNSELQAIRNYLENISTIVDHKGILIDGTDSWVEGTWTFFNMTQLPVIDWHPRNPNGGDCMVLAATNGQRMIDVWCDVPEDWQGSRYPYRYMCEIPA